MNGPIPGVRTRTHNAAPMQKSGAARIAALRTSGPPHQRGVRTRVKDTIDAPCHQSNRSAPVAPIGDRCARRAAGRSRATPTGYQRPGHHLISRSFGPLALCGVRDRCSTGRGGHQAGRTAHLLAPTPARLFSTPPHAGGSGSGPRGREHLLDWWVWAPAHVLPARPRHPRTGRRPASRRVRAG